MKTKKEKLKICSPHRFKTTPRRPSQTVCHPMEICESIFMLSSGVDQQRYPQHARHAYRNDPEKKFKFDPGQQTSQCQGRLNNWARMSHEDTKFLKKTEGLKE